jgi:hypothetical protein
VQVRCQISDNGKERLPGANGQVAQLFAHLRLATASTRAIVNLYSLKLAKPSETGVIGSSFGHPVGSGKHGTSEPESCAGRGDFLAGSTRSPVQSGFSRTLPSREIAEKP